MAAPTADEWAESVIQGLNSTLQATEDVGGTNFELPP